MTSLRCAIYTRKSTEEGLEQEFNSLDAQREACEAYIKSQAGEGWRLVAARYDDGGFSGGSMERPALKRLLADLDANRVDVVVVYKVDRLTRSLADFVRIVERFDAAKASFVSVTQQFNTTTSMGRLTLNMLLSFAQFEREVTGERIRDKIAASKRKGMWMGGLVPLGYDLADRKLVINPAEAETVRTLFTLYLEHRNVALVKLEADRRGIRTKHRADGDGRIQGGGAFSRGHLYRLLANPLYVGEICHRQARYPGEHPAIIDRETWDIVQATLAGNASPRAQASNVSSGSLLAGLVHDGLGRPMKPSHAVKSGRRYRYYITRPSDEAATELAWRLPAPALEAAVLDGLRAYLRDPHRLVDSLGLMGQPPDRLAAVMARAAAIADGAAGASMLCALLADWVVRIDTGLERLRITLRPGAVRRQLADAHSTAEGTGQIVLDLPIVLKRRGVETRLVLLGKSERSHRDPDPTLIAAIAQGHRWFYALRDGEAASVGTLAARDGANQGDISRVLPLGLLAPDIVEAILAGEHSADLTATRLKRTLDLPLSWAEQRLLLGLAP